MNPPTTIPSRWTRRLQSLLTPARYRHSLSTAAWAAELAGLHGVRQDRAYIAGLLHDAARDLPTDRLSAVLRSYRGRYADAEVRAAPPLWHDPASMLLAYRDFGVRDGGILRAIGRHSIGGPAMRPLDAILYLADYTEPKRPFPQARRLRDLAKHDLRAALSDVVRHKLAYLRGRGISPHSSTLAMARELGLNPGEIKPKRR